MRLWILLAVAGLWLLTACSRPQTPEESDSVAADLDEDSEEVVARGDWMIRWLLADPESLNPLTSNDSASSEVQGPILSTLLTLDPKSLENVPLVASALPTVSEDHLTYRFTIRSDVTFSDGVPLTVDDVIFSLKAIKNPEVNAPHLRNYYLSIVDASASDPLTVEFHCQEPYFRNDIMIGGIPILARHFYDPDGLLDDVSVRELADWEGIDAKKKESARRFAERFNADYHRKILGAGAYVLDDPKRNLITGERIVLDRREGYWAPEDPVRGDGYVDRFFFRIINNQDAALVSLKAGTLDVMGLTPLQHTRQTDTPGFKARFNKATSYAPSYVYVGWNSKRPVLRDKKVRQALAHLIDRDRIIEKVLFGYGEKIDSPVYRFRSEYNTNLRGYPYDPAAGMRMLEDAGWTDTDDDGIRDKEIDGKRTPLRMEIISNSGNAIRKSIGLITIDQLKRAGIAASFREVDWSILLDRIGRFDYDAVILGWVMSVNDPDLFQLFHSSQAVAGGSNHVSFSSSEADRILEEYRREFDENRRIELYWRLQEIIHEEAPYAFLYMPKSISAYSVRFRDTVWYASGSPNLYEWWVPLNEQRYGH